VFQTNLPVRTTSPGGRAARLGARLVFAGLVVTRLVVISAIAKSVSKKDLKK
jgi:hypothetical protein